MPASQAKNGGGLSWTQWLVRTAGVLVLVVAYHLAFHPLHTVMDRAAFAAGLVPVMFAGATLGIRAALGAAIIVGLFDRGHALGLDPAEVDTGPLAGLLTLLMKAAVGVGVGWLRSLMLRLRSTNEQLAAEVAVRQNLARSLRQSDQLHRSLLDSMGEGVGLFDSKDRFLFANHAAERLLGAPPLGLIGVELTELVAPESRAELERARSFSVDEPVCYDIRLATNARVVLVTDTALQGDVAGGARRLRVMRDVTERARLEREQRELDAQLQRAQALQSLAVLAGGVAHDFNNLLGGVVGNAELALLKLGSDAPKDVVTSLEEIKSFSRQATDLSRQMLAYAGKRALALENIALGDEIEHVLKLMHSGIAARASLELRCDPGLPAIRADRVQIRQVIMNLVMNALEAMEHGRGRLLIATERAEAPEPVATEATSGPGFVALTVSDSGAGMSEETRARIFEPFFSTKFTGRGMGLAATQGIVKAHHGRIQVESTPGAGSTFRVLFPAIREAPVRAAASLPPPALSAGGRTVLLVDDELAVRSVTSRMLEELGFGVVIADDGDRAVELLRARPAGVDVVLLDLTMPRMSGGEALGELRRIVPELRVVLTSGYHAADAGDLVRAPGVRGFLPKPHTLSGLKRALHAALEG